MNIPIPGQVSLFMTSLLLLAVILVLMQLAETM